MAHSRQLASDIYSLGVLVEHLLGGSPPPIDGALDVAEGPASAVVRRATDPDPRPPASSRSTNASAELRDAFAVPASADGGVRTDAQPVPRPRGVRAGRRRRLLRPRPCGRRDGRRSPARAAADRRRPIWNRQVVRRQGRLAARRSPLVRYRDSDRWLVTELVPGREPFEKLAAALGRVASTDVPDVVGVLLSGSRPLGAVVDELAPGNPGVLIVIDQLEELFTQTIDDTERRAFLRMLVDVAQTPDSTVRLVATLRADYFDRPLAYPGFDDAIHGRTVALGAMSSDELADAVRLPASAVGVQIETGVVDRIVAEAELQPGALPLVQHTLSELFRTRTTNTMTVADLDERRRSCRRDRPPRRADLPIVRRSLPRRRASRVPPARQRHRGARRHTPACPPDGARAGRDRHRRPRHGARRSTAATDC